MILQALLDRLHAHSIPSDSQSKNAWRTTGPFTKNVITTRQPNSVHHLASLYDDIRQIIRAVAGSGLLRSSHGV
jgi:hypothetical protein